tara:strand:+ start:1323 stop:1757 length:435 start_codon:yes stop_codon:yes gene_type:complete
MPTTVSYNSTLKMGALVSNAYSAPTVAVGEVLSINFDGATQAIIDTTSLVSTMKSFKVGTVDPGSISLEVNLDQDDPSQALLIAAASDQTGRSYLITYGVASTGGCTISGIAFVTSFSIKAGIDTVLTASFSLKLSGAYTLAPL